MEPGNNVEQNTANEVNTGNIPVTSGGASQASQPTTAPPSPPKKNPLLKFGKIPLIVAAVFIVLSASAAAYFGVIVPNNPNALWKRSMTVTSKGMEKYLEYTQQFQSSKGSKFNGTFNAEMSGVIADGNFEGHVYENDASIKADFGAAGSRVNMELLLDTPENSNNPDIYMRVKGLEGLSSVLGVTEPGVSELLAEVNNQWYVIDHTLLDQAYASGSQDAGISELTPEEIYTIQETFVRVTNEYVFSTAPDKAVMTVQQSVGKEEIDGRKVQHYKVGINKENMKQYVTTLKDELKKTKLGEMFKDPGFEQAIQFDDIIKSIDELSESDSFDVWVDRDTKLLRKVKITDKDNDKNFLEVSLNYDGGTNFPLVLHIENQEEKDAGSFTLKVDQDTAKKNATLELAFDTEAPTKSKGSIKMVAEPSDEAVKIDKPKDAKSFYELIGVLMGGSVTVPGTSDSTSVFSDFDL